MYVTILQPKDLKLKYNTGTLQFLIPIFILISKSLVAKSKSIAITRKAKKIKTIISANYTYFYIIVLVKALGSS